MSDHSLNRQYDVYAAAREAYRQKIDEQADRIAQLEAALRDIDGCSAQAHVRRIARVALEERT